MRKDIRPMHTSVPWAAVRMGEDIVILSPRGPVATMRDDGAEETAANAALIAAAPDLLAALRAMMEAHATPTARAAARAARRVISEAMSARKD